MKQTLIALLALAQLLTAAEQAPKPKPARTRRPVRVIVVKPYYDPATEAASIAGSVIGNLIGNWIARRGERSEFNQDTVVMGQADINFEPRPRVPVEPQEATYFIQASQGGSEVLIDSKPVGIAPVTLTLKSGSHYIVVRHAGFETWAHEVESHTGEEVTVQADLKPVEVTPDVIVIRPSAPRQ